MKLSYTLTLVTIVAAASDLLLEGAEGRLSSDGAVNTRNAKKDKGGKKKKEKVSTSIDTDSIGR